MKIFLSNKAILFKKNKGWDGDEEDTKTGPWNLCVMFYTWRTTFSGIVHVSWIIQEVILNSSSSWKKPSYPWQFVGKGTDFAICNSAKTREFNISAFS